MDRIAQRRRVLAHLNALDENGDRLGLTHLEAFALYRITRLAARIQELRADGMEIESEWKQDRTGKRYVKYHLINP